ncbi:hypothetical protein D9619_012038 [Psilocybe cf. subviscida]|uniref:Uncharacterized protein n=1 Tax=Psilocybe cf. subviscida TaxID=2480587 RepID=A0A8H5B7T2_9AGAR|nr:hypothetical protein D9619_012038 [Psilocybe cf. subviscida]
MDHSNTPSLLESPNNKLASGFLLNLNIGVPQQADENVGAEVSYHLAGVETDVGVYSSLDVDLTDTNGNIVEAGDMPYAEAADAVVESLLRSRAPIRITIYSEPPRVSNDEDDGADNTNPDANIGWTSVSTAPDTGSLNARNTSDKSLENKQLKASCSGCCRDA